MFELVGIRGCVLQEPGKTGACPVGAALERSDFAPADSGCLDQAQALGSDQYDGFALMRRQLRESVTQVRRDAPAFLLGLAREPFGILSIHVLDPSPRLA